MLLLFGVGFCVSKLVNVFPEFSLVLLFVFWEFFVFIDGIILILMVFVTWRRS